MWCGDRNLLSLSRMMFDDFPMIVTFLSYARSKPAFLYIDLGLAGKVRIRDAFFDGQCFFGADITVGNITARGWVCLSYALVDIVIFSKNIWRGLT
jgi:hypothetical protein